MPKTLFSPEELTPTNFSTAQDKAAFGNQFFRQIESGWKETVFTTAFYMHLSNCFGHIAHYDRSGFYSTWLAEDKTRLSFLEHTLNHPCYGEPFFTFCDVERAIQRELRRRPILAQQEARVAAATHAREIAHLERLQAKYGATVCSPLVVEPVFWPQQGQRPMQINLF